MAANEDVVGVSWIDHERVEVAAHVSPGSRTGRNRSSAVPGVCDHQEADAGNTNGDREDQEERPRGRFDLLT